MALQVTSCTLWNHPDKLLGKGAAYLRTRTNTHYLIRSQEKQRSAVELLAESKAQYVKSSHVLDGRQSLGSTNNNKSQSNNSCYSITSTRDDVLLSNSYSTHSALSTDNSEKDYRSTLRLTESDLAQKQKNYSKNSSCTCDWNKKVITHHPPAAGRRGDSPSFDEVADDRFASSALCHRTRQALPRHIKDKTTTATVDNNSYNRDWVRSLAGRGINTSQHHHACHCVGPGDIVCTTKRPGEETPYYSENNVCENNDDDTVNTDSGFCQEYYSKDIAMDSSISNLSKGRRYQFAHSCSHSSKHNHSSLCRLSSASFISSSASMNVSVDSQDEPLSVEDRLMPPQSAYGPLSSGSSTGASPQIHRAHSPLPRPRSPYCAALLAQSNSPHGQSCEEDMLEEVVSRRQKKSVHRSQSDLSSRKHGIHTELLESRSTRAGSDLERFFNQMGLEKDVLDPMLRQQSTRSYSSDVDCQESISAIDTPDARSICSGLTCSDRAVGLTVEAVAVEPRAPDKVLMPAPVQVTTQVSAPVPAPATPVQTSVVERNARIIKWLCSVRRARSQLSQQSSQSVSITDSSLDKT